MFANLNLLSFLLGFFSVFIILGIVVFVNIIRIASREAQKDHEEN